MRGSLGIDVWDMPMLMTRSPVESRLVVGEHQRVSTIGTSSASSGQARRRSLIRTATQR